MVMKGKRWILLTILVLVLFLGWYLSIRAASGADDIAAQKKLVEQADSFAEKELYIRALPLYQQAMTYKTAKNPEIERRMLKVHIAREDITSYLKLVEERLLGNRALEEEILSAAELYLAQTDLDEAMTILKKGMEIYPNGKCEEMFEEYRYSHAVHMTKVQEILPTAENDLMPAFDGEKWGFVDSRGSFVLPAIYDSVVPFNKNGYSVVSLQGTYYSIVPSGEKYGLDETGVTDVIGLNASYIIARHNDKYSYYNTDFRNVTPEIQFDEMTINSGGVVAAREKERWAIISDDGKKVTDFIYEDVAVNSLGQVFVNGKGMVKMEDGLWYLVDTEGKKLCNTGFANAKAPEANNYIAVSNQSGKWGFIDVNGEQVIDFQYNDAWSFSNNVGAVKIGDTWGYISRKNKLVIQEPLEEAKPFHNYAAQAEFQGSAVIVSLDYHEY